MNPEKKWCPGKRPDSVNYEAADQFVQSNRRLPYRHRVIMVTGAMSNETTICCNSSR